MLDPLFVRPSLSRLLALSVGLAACSSSSSGTTPKDAGGTHEEAGKADAGPTIDIDAETPSGMTIAKARQAYAKTGTAQTITVNAVVTGVQGTATDDQVYWYVEDPQGGPYSGISVYCDPLAATTCPCMASCANHVAAPPIHTLVSISGTISAYHDQYQLEPSTQKILKMNETPPPVYTVSASDLAEGGNSPYRGVYVSFPGMVKVTDTEPAALYDSQCLPDGGTGMPLCTGYPCSPPTYSGFEVNGPGADAFFVEEFFFGFVPLENSPDCFKVAGAVIVKDEQTFPHMAGILDYDGFAGKQYLAPVQPSDY
jgi:hypothetical protein